MAYNCIVVGCTNSKYKLNKWKYELCTTHNFLHENEKCSCPEPFMLHRIPTSKKDPELREKWKKMINRTKEGSKTELFEPGKDARVCSLHFVDGKPTSGNPLPTVNLGYDSDRRASVLSPPSRQVYKRKQSFPKPSKLNFEPDDKNNDVQPPPMQKQLITISYNSTVSSSVDNTPSTSIATPNPTIKRINKTLNMKMLNLSMKKKKAVVKLQLKKQVHKELLFNDKKCLFYTNILKSTYSMLYMIMSSLWYVTGSKGNPQLLLML